MTEALEYCCRWCGAVHRGLSAWHFDEPLGVPAVPPDERARRVDLTSDGCVITHDDGEPTEFYVKGLLEVPVRGATEPFVWGVWLSLSEESFARYVELHEDERRAPGETFFGWLANRVPGYPDTSLLKTMVHVRAYPLRPWVELEPTDHPLAVEQREGISRERAVEIAERLLHPDQSG